MLELHQSVVGAHLSTHQTQSRKRPSQRATVTPLCIMMPPFPLPPRPPLFLPPLLLPSPFYAPCHQHMVVEATRPVAGCPLNNRL
jgi:hypothetical protein